MVFLHCPVQTAHRHKVAFCISSSLRAIVGGDRLVGRLDSDAQRRIEDEKNVEPNSEKARHR